MSTYNLYINVIGRDEASHALHNVAGALGRIGEFAIGNLLANSIMRIGDSLRSIGAEALSAMADYERLGLSLESLVAREMLNAGGARNMADALRQAQPAARDLLDWIQRLAIHSPFRQEDVAQAFRMAMAYGFTTREAKQLTQAMIDFAAGSGASGESMRLIALALGQIRARGKLAGQEILQLTNAGIPVRQILANAFGVTTAELENMIAKGLVPADRAIEAIVSTLERDFGGAARRQTETFAGLISTLEDIKSVGLREFFTGTFQAIKPYLVEFVDLLSSPETMEKIRLLGQEFGRTVAEAVAFVRTNWPTIESALLKLAEVLSKSGEAARDMWNNYLQPALSSLSRWISENRETLLNIWQKFDETIGSNLRSARGVIVGDLLPALRSLSEWLDSDGIQAVEKFLDKLSEYDDVREDWLEFIGELRYDTRLALNGMVGDARVTLPKLQDIVGWVMDSIATRTESKTGVLRGVWKVFTSSLQLDFARAREGIDETNYELFRGMLAYIGINLPRVQGGFKTIFDGIWRDTEQFGRGMVERVSDALGSAVRNVYEQQRRWADAGRNIMDALIGSIVARAAGVLGAITTPFANALNTILSYDWAGAARSVMAAMANTLSSWFGKLVNAIVSPYNNAYNTISGINWGGLAWTLASSMYDTVSSWSGNLVRAVVSPFMSAYNTIAGIDWGGLARNVANAIWSMLNEWVGALRGILVSPFSNAFSAIHNTDWAGLAWNVGQTIWSTLTSWADSIFHAIWDPFSAAIEAIKRLLGISSPSRLMQQIGRQMREGLEIGFTSQPMIHVNRLTSRAGTGYAGSVTSNYYNLTIHSHAKTENVIADFAMLKALAGN